ncbi:MAG: signal peptidase II [Nannocystaceae bacterium]|nr:signal peptidase II [Nannocystaceae bacterium]
MADPTPTPATPEPSRRSRLVLLAIVVAVTLGLDLWSKAWAWEALRTGDSVEVISGWFYFEFGFNTGSAFSFLRDASYSRQIFIGVTILALLYMAKLAMTLPTRWASAYLAIGLVSGGAMGNLHDRLVRIMDVRGEPRYGVVDFIKVFYWKDQPWPTFNVADIALVVGVGLLFIFLTRHGEAVDAQAKDKDKAKGDAKAEPAAAAAPKKDAAPIERDERAAPEPDAPSA